MAKEEIKDLAEWMIEQGGNISLKNSTVEQVNIDWNGGPAKVSCNLFVSMVMKSNNSLASSSWYQYPTEFKVSGSCHLECRKTKKCECPCGESLTVQVAGGGAMPSYDSYGSNMKITSDLK